MRWLPIVALVVLGSIAHADDKQTVAVLGVLPKEPASSKVASALTSAIRAIAAREYTLKGSPKDIDAAILAADCTATQPTCAAKLGAALNAELAVAGEVERRGGHNDLLLVHVDVAHKQRIRSVRQSGADPVKQARAAFARLVGGDLGELAILVNAPRGDVLIDGQIAAGLFEGRATIGGLVRGSHLLAIHAKGYKPLEVAIKIEGETKQMLLLDPE